MVSVAGVWVAILLQACSMNKEPAIDYIHANGLFLRLPASMFVRHLPGGFVVAIAASLQNRVPEQVFITLRHGVSRPAGEWPERKIVAGRLFPHRLEHDEGGSGGGSHTLTAWHPYADGYVLISQVVQAEWPAVPDYSLAWTVMHAIREPQAPGISGAIPGEGHTLSSGP